MVDTSDVQLMVGRPFAPKADQNGAQQTEKGTGRPLNVVQFVAIDEAGAETINGRRSGSSQVDSQQQRRRDREVVRWEPLCTCTDAVGWEAKGMIAIRESARVVLAPPGGSVSVTTDQLDQAEAYGQAGKFGLEMLRRQARQQRKHAARDRGHGSDGRVRGGA